MDWNNFLKDSGKAALAAVFPENIYCICCGDVTDPDSRSGLCFRCSEKLPWAFENPFRSYMDEFAFDDVWPCVRYGSYARKIMNGLKNGGQSYMAENVGQMLAERVQLEWDMPDLFAAVPSHRSKMQKRGYNQSELLAEAVAKRLKLSMLEDSFAVSSRFASLVPGKKVCLVDDVTTTGSTADACARALKAAGAAKVVLLVFGASSGYKKVEENGAAEP